MLSFRIVIGAIGGEEFRGLDRLQVVQEVGRRHACELQELPVEMAVIRESKMVDQAVEGGNRHADHPIGYLMETQDAQELLGRETDMFDKDPAELSFAEASHLR